uniref:CSON007527 protein n=1 Tax=Culicoides sonorensis TaxID=179676 RepID=A0A336M0F6_CULSO
MLHQIEVQYIQMTVHRWDIFRISSQKSMIALAEIDTGACVSVIDSFLYNEKLKNVKLCDVTDKKFNNANGKECVVLGKINLCLNFKYQVQAIVIKSEHRKIVKRLRILNNTHAYTSSIAISCCSRTATNIVVVK